MPCSANQGRDSIGKLVYEEKIADLSDYSHRETKDETTLIHSTYQDSSADEWIDSPNPIDLTAGTSTDDQLEELLTT